MWTTAVSCPVTRHTIVTGATWTRALTLGGHGVLLSVRANGGETRMPVEWECKACDETYENYASFQYHMLTEHGNREGK